MLAGQTLIVVSTIDTHVPLNILTKLLTDLGKDLFFAFRAHGLVGEVGVHTRAVPIEIAKGLRMPVDGVTILFTGTLKQIACNPSLIACLLRSLGEHLKFPLACGYFSVNTFHIDACF